MRTPIEFAAGLCTADNDEPKRRVVHVYPGEDFSVVGTLKEGERVSIVIVDPLAELQRFFGILAVVFGVISVFGWAVIQILRGSGVVS